MHAATISLSGKPLTMTYGYDAGGRLTSITYPSGKKIVYAYDAAGRVSSLMGGELAHKPPQPGIPKPRKTGPFTRPSCKNDDLLRLNKANLSATCGFFTADSPRLAAPSAD